MRRQPGTNPVLPARDGEQLADRDRRAAAPVHSAAKATLLDQSRQGRAEGKGEEEGEAGDDARDRLVRAGVRAQQ